MVRKYFSSEILIIVIPPILETVMLIFSEEIEKDLKLFALNQRKFIAGNPVRKVSGIPDRKFPTFCGPEFWQEISGHFGHSGHSGKCPGKSGHGALARYSRKQIIVSFTTHGRN